MTSEYHKDEWRKTIIKEREAAHIHSLLMGAVKKIQSTRRNHALVLGDASLVQSAYLLSIAGFKKVTAVDSSSSLMDDYLMSATDTRLERVQCSFDTYGPAEGELFDLVYGKSIAFSPKHSIIELLKTIKKVLAPQGVFAAEFAGEKDTFRPFHYTADDLERKYTEAGFGSIKLRERPAKQIMGYLREGISHTFTIMTIRR